MYLHPGYVLTLELYTYVHLHLWRKSKQKTFDLETLIEFC